MCSNNMLASNCRTLERCCVADVSLAHLHYYILASFSCHVAVLCGVCLFFLTRHRTRFKAHFAHVRIQVGVCTCMHTWEYSRMRRHVFLLTQHACQRVTRMMCGAHHLDIFQRKKFFCCGAVYRSGKSHDRCALGSQLAHHHSTDLNEMGKSGHALHCPACESVARSMSSEVSWKV